MPKSRIEFWQAKFEANMTRDRKVLRELQNRDWTVQIIWECETQDPVELDRRLLKAFRLVGAAR